jgi:hypothetical protein
LSLTYRLYFTIRIQLPTLSYTLGGAVCDALLQEGASMQVDTEEDPEEDLDVAACAQQQQVDALEGSTAT